MSSSLFWKPRSAGEFDAGPCKGGCSPAECLKDGAHGILIGDPAFYAPWECDHGIWLMPSAPSGPRVSQDANQDISALVAFSEAQMLKDLRQRAVLSFGEIAYMEDLEFYVAETPQQREARQKAMRERDAQEGVGIILGKVKRKEEKWTKKGVMEFRICAPCRYASLLLQRTCAGCSAKVPQGQDTCSAMIVKVEEQERRHDGKTAGTGKMISRLAKAGDIGVRICGEALAGCWNHEQHGTCIYVHPEERQWADALAGRMPRKLSSQEYADWNGAAKPAAPVNRFAALGGGGSSAARGGGASAAAAAAAAPRGSAWQQKKW